MATVMTESGAVTKLDFLRNWTVTKVHKFDPTDPMTIGVEEGEKLTFQDPGGDDLIFKQKTLHFSPRGQMVGDFNVHADEEHALVVRYLGLCQAGDELATGGYATPGRRVIVGILTNKNKHPGGSWHAES